MEKIGEKTESILEVNASSLEELDSYDCFHPISESHSQLPDYASENSKTENPIEDHKASLSPELLFNENSMFVPAKEYYEVMYKNRLSRGAFYYKYVYSNKQIPYIRMPRKGKGGRGDEYIFLINDPEIIKKIKLRRQIEEKSNKKKYILVNLPEKMLREFKNVMTPYSPLYKEFLSYLRSEENKNKILKKEGKNEKKKIKIQEEYYNLLLEYAQELNVEISDVLPILLKNFIEDRMGKEVN